ncbi:tRNA-His guanylyltransferase [Zalaria obscura]|uniref:tRNA-His guanylyltransferase n=1 Tax=Zalaria obscura TaxID=2024903 RepID=A0ACC3SEN1_9PEZI
MANSEFQYVRLHETWDGLAPDNWIVVRIDGKGFSKFTKRYDFAKPNDRRAIDLMNAAAVEVVKQFVDIVVAYGQSDEYSFVFHEDTTLFDRRAFKLATTIATTFSVEYALQWPQFFPGQPLTRPFPTFDGRTVLYPKLRNLRDYLSWRQADCHINNLYNTTFWSMVQLGGMTPTAAELELKKWLNQNQGTVSADKNEILFSRFKINYNNEPEVYRKGSVVFREFDDPPPSTDTNIDPHSATNPPTPTQPHQTQTKPLSKTQAEKERKRRQKARVVVEHVDIIKDGFWDSRPWILASRGGGRLGGPGEVVGRE